MRKIILSLIILIISILFIGCTDAGVISQRISKDADYFKINRRIIFYNGITGQYMLVITGLCSINDRKTSLTVTCKVGKDKYIKHYLGLSDNVTYFAEQIKSSIQNPYHYKVIFKPSVIVPDITIK